MFKTKDVWEYREWVFLMEGARDCNNIPKGGIYDKLTRIEIQLSNI